VAIHHSCRLGNARRTARRKGNFNSASPNPSRSTSTAIGRISESTFEERTGYDFDKCLLRYSAISRSGSGCTTAAAWIKQVNNWTGCSGQTQTVSTEAYSQCLKMLRVLFLHSDDVAAKVRIRPMLETLSSAGKIRLATVGRNMALTGARSDRYDALLGHRNLSRRQQAWLTAREIPFVYDIDDLLLSDEVGGARRIAEQRAIRWCLEHASVVTAPSRRLLRALGDRLPGGLGTRANHLANPGRETPSAAKAPALPRFFWASSAQPMDATDLDEACLGINDAVQSLNTEIVMVGRFPQRLLDFFPSRRVMDWIEPSAYLDLLAGEPLIAVAPLSLKLPIARQAFADCKSDIKVAQFGSSRIAGAYSAAPPFAESDLPCTIVPQNTRAAWSDGLLGLARGFPGEGNRQADDPAFARRRPTVLGEQLHQILLQTAAMTEPFSFRAISTPNVARTIERRIRTLRSKIFRPRQLAR
jgi:hypothetical protein